MHTPFFGHFRFARAAVMMLLVVFLCSGNVLAGDRALIVMSSGSSQYQISAKSAGETLRQLGSVEVVIKELSDILQSDLDLLGADDVCMVIGAKAAVGIGQKLDPDVPMVYTMVPNPSSLGLEERPNTVGISADVSPADQFVIMQRAFAGVKQVGMLYSSGSVRSTEILRQAREQLPAGWVLEAVDMDLYSSSSKGVDALIDLGVDFIWMIADPKVYNAATVKALLISSIRHKQKVFAFSPQVVRAGALIGIGIDPGEQGRIVGGLAALVIENGMDAALRKRIVIRPQIAVNKVVAERIKVEISNTLVQEAEYLYE